MLFQRGLEEQSFSPDKVEANSWDSEHEFSLAFMPIKF